jgi:tRNA 2-thiocytidine biosynthesis protein TtcA
MFASLSNIAPSLLMDHRLFDFRALHRDESLAGEDDAWLDENGS